MCTCVAWTRRYDRGVCMSTVPRLRDPSAEPRPRSVWSLTVHAPREAATERNQPKRLQNTILPALPSARVEPALWSSRGTSARVSAPRAGMWR